MSSNKTLPVISSWYCMPTQIAAMSFGSIAINALFAKVTKPILCETQKNGKDSKHFVSIPAKQQLVGY